MAKDIASFPRADTDIIKSEDMMTALPVPRSSSEVIKPSELFLDLMMLDPLKTKAVSETKPSTAPRTNEASTKEITPIAACSTFSAAQAVQQSPPAAKESQSSLAQQMVANATAAAASMPFCQAAPCHSIPEGPRIPAPAPQPVGGSGYGYTLMASGSGRDYPVRPQYNPVPMSYSTLLPSAQAMRTASSSSQRYVSGADQAQQLPSRTYIQQPVQAATRPSGQASMALPVRSIPTSIQGRPSGQWSTPGAFAMPRVATVSGYPLMSAPAPAVTYIAPKTAPTEVRRPVSMLLPAAPAMASGQPRQLPSQAWPMQLHPQVAHHAPVSMGMAPQRRMPLPGAMVMPPARASVQGGHTLSAHAVAMNAQARFPLPS